MCQQTWPKRWFGNMHMTSNCDVTNSAHQIQITTACHWLKSPVKIFCERHCFAMLHWWQANTLHLHLVLHPSITEHENRQTASNFFQVVGVAPRFEHSLPASMARSFSLFDYLQKTNPNWTKTNQLQPTCF